MEKKTYIVLEVLSAVSAAFPDSKNFVEEK